MAVGQLVGGRP